MKKVLLLSLFGVFAYANDPVKEETKEIEKAGTSICRTSSVSGSNSNGSVNFTTQCCVTLEEGYSTSDLMMGIVSAQNCADDKRDSILGILGE
jgi:hypothetical protein